MPQPITATFKVEAGHSGNSGVESGDTFDSQALRPGGPDWNLREDSGVEGEESLPTKGRDHSGSDAVESGPDIASVIDYLGEADKGGRGDGGYAPEGEELIPTGAGPIVPEDSSGVGDAFKPVDPATPMLNSDIKGGVQDGSAVSTGDGTSEVLATHGRDHSEGATVGTSPNPVDLGPDLPDGAEPVGLQHAGTSPNPVDLGSGDEAFIPVDPQKADIDETSEVDDVGQDIALVGHGTGVTGDDLGGLG